MTTETETPTEYTPTTDEVREYVAVGGEPRPWEPPKPEMDAARAAAFDRWLAAHDREVAARALHDAADELERLVDSQHPVAVNPDAWLRDRAIESGEADE